LKYVDIELLIDAMKLLVDSLTKKN